MQTVLIASTATGDLVQSTYSDAKLDAVLADFERFMKSTNLRLDSLEAKTAPMIVEGKNVTFSNSLSADYLNSTGGTIGVSDGRIQRSPGNAVIEIHPNWNGYAEVGEDGNVRRRCEAHRNGREGSNCL